MTPHHAPVLLLVDDETPVLNALHRVVHRHFGPRLEVASTTSPAEARRWAAHRPFAVVMSDLRMPAYDGLRLLGEVARLQPHAALLLLTGAADLDTALRAVNQVGVFRYLTKPWQDEELVAHLQAALDHSQTLQQQALAADAWASEHGQMSAQEAERHRLEALDPGITKVQWGPGGEVLMPALTPATAPALAPSLAPSPPPRKARSPGHP